MEAVKTVARKPGVVIQSSAVGYYGVHGDEEIPESTPAGNDYLAGVAVAWENSTAPVEAMGVRRAVIRTGVVLSNKGGALPQMLLPFKLFAGGPLGNGKQWLPWIHIADEVGAIRFLIENRQASGAFNLCAPNPLTNAEFGRVIGRVMGRPAFMPTPGFRATPGLWRDGDRPARRSTADTQAITGTGLCFPLSIGQAALRDILR